MILLVCVYVLKVLGCLCFVSCFGRDSCCCDVVVMLLRIVFLEIVSCGLSWVCVGKVISWTSLVRVSSHGERKEKEVECMGLYLPPLACMVKKLRLKGLASL